MLPVILTREVDEYLATQFSEHPAKPGLAAVIHRHSDGNPLFMVAIVAVGPILVII